MRLWIRATFRGPQITWRVRSYNAESYDMGSREAATEWMERHAPTATVDPTRMRALVDAGVFCFVLRSARW